jgi:hypothetical protein
VGAGIYEVASRAYFWLNTLGKEYARADFRWGYSDETVVSLEILTVLGAGPICCYILRQLIKDDPARHFWIVILSTAELYGGYVSPFDPWKSLDSFIASMPFRWMTFCPEWLNGSPNLDTSNPLYLWVYLFVCLVDEVP